MCEDYMGLLNELGLSPESPKGKDLIRLLKEAEAMELLFMIDVSEEDIRASEQEQNEQLEVGLEELFVDLEKQFLKWLEDEWQ